MQEDSTVFPNVLLMITKKREVPAPLAMTLEICETQLRILIGSLTIVFMKAQTLADFVPVDL